MNKSNSTERNDERQNINREPRIEAIKTWVEYIKSEPPETWGPQQNAIVNGQLEAAQNAQLSASHRQHVEDIASEILKKQHSSEENSK